jgi:hypothetical protein
MYADETYYLLQNSNCPVGAWDWREYATCYGPFKDFEAAEQHLDRNHPNPGGYSVQKGNTENKVMIDLVKQLKPEPCCRMCGHAASDTPRGSFDIMEFTRHGWETFGHVEEQGVCVPCHTSMKANGDIK